MREALLFLEDDAGASAAEAVEGDIGVEFLWSKSFLAKKLV